MTDIGTAYKHDLSVAGDVQNRSPDFFNRTPTNIIAASDVYSAAEITVISTDDLNFVQNFFAVVVQTTGRSSHLFEFDIDTPNLLREITNLTTFAHLIGANPTVHQQKTYIWNAVTLAWEEIATSTGNAVPRTMSGSVADNFSDYVDALNKLYILHWDWEGVFRTGGGCVKSDTLIHTPRGKILVSELKPWETIYGWQDGKQVDRKIDEITQHKTGQIRKFTKLETTNGTLTLTNNHIVPLKVGDKRAGEVSIGDMILGIEGIWFAVQSVSRFEEDCEVYDIHCRAPNYFTNDGIAVSMMNGY